MKKIIIFLAFCLLSVGVASAQQNFSITSNSAGVVRLGMTIAQARKALKGYKLKRTSDGEGIALVEVSRKGKTVMTLQAGEENAYAPVNEKAKIEFIQVWDANYKTTAGIHPQMLVKVAEKKLGKVTKVITSEIEQREYATFTKKPKGLMFRVEGKETNAGQNSAGIYLKGKRHGTKTTAGAYIVSISVADYYPL